jgi:voltage-dependent potassium channel beta subunit
MEYRAAGVSGLKLSKYGLGGWTTFGESVSEQEQVTRIIRAAFDAGINLFDIADVYAIGRSETAMGRALADLPRNELVITSKVFWPMSEDVNDRGLSRKHVMESVEKSLKRIGTDYLDIYFCHRFDPDTPLEETARAMDDLIHQGKILYWGTSEWTGEELDAAAALADARNLYAPVIEQPQYSLVARPKVETDVLPAAQRHGMGLMAWSPLASGLLTGKYDDGVPDDSRFARIGWVRKQVLQDHLVERVKAFRGLADEVGCSRAQLALSWAAAQPGMSSILLGVNSTEQLEENLGALDVEITPAIAERLDAIFPPDAPAP